MDVAVHGEPAYPKISYGSGWGVDSDYVMDSVPLIVTQSDSEEENTDELIVESKH